MANTFEVHIAIPPYGEDHVIYSGRVLHSRQEAEQEADELHASNRARGRDACEYHIKEFADPIHCISDVIYTPKTESFRSSGSAGPSIPR